ncbi:SdpI family protein [Ornithobacterium rhinotracheale]
MESGVIELLLIDLILMLLPVVFYFFPPKKMNSLYGYRTLKSFKDQRSWDFAQRYSAKRLLQISFIIMLLQITMILLGVDANIENSYLLSVTLLSYIIGLIICVISTEIALKKQNF